MDTIPFDHFTVTITVAALYIKALVSSKMLTMDHNELHAILFNSVQ